MTAEQFALLWERGQEREQRQERVVMAQAFGAARDAIVHAVVALGYRQARGGRLPTPWYMDQPEPLAGAALDAAFDALARRFPGRVDA